MTESVKGNRTDKIVAMNKERSIQRQEEVLKVIASMKKKVIKITFYSVAKEAKASKAYLYGNETIATAIRAEREVATPITKNSEKSIIKALQLENRELKAALKKANDNGYKAKYEKAEEEIALLKQQLASSYTVWE